MLPSFWVASTKPEAALARSQGLKPWQGRGWTLAQRDRGPEAGGHLLEEHHHQLDLVMPGMTPWCARSRKQMRQRPNLRKTARGRPQRLQRELFRTLYRDGRDCLTTSDFLAMRCYCSLPSAAKGMPRPRRSVSACSSVFAEVVIATSRPRTCWMSS